MTKYSYLKKIGEGGFAIVYKGYWREQEVAVKALKRTFLEPDEFFKEMNLLIKLRTPFIVNFIGVCLSKNWLVMEFAKLGSLATIIDKKKYPLSLKLKILIALDAAQGMNFLHNSNIIHRDFKTDNILVTTLDITSQTRIKINDFGTSREHVSNVGETLNFTKAVGTPSHMAPEILRKQPYKFAADVYSYGVALYHLFTEIEPYSSFDSVFSIAEFVLSGKRLDIPSYVPTQIKDLIQITWSDKPEQRRGFSDIVGYLLLLNDTIEEESYAESSFDVRKEKILDIKKR